MLVFRRVNTVNFAKHPGHQMSGPAKNGKAPASRIALATGDAELSRQVHDLLHRLTGQPPLAGSFADLRPYLARDTDGLLLLGVATAADRVEARHLVQDICLQRLPPTVVVLDALGEASDLAPLDRYIARRLAWPAEAAALEPIVREMGRGREFRVDRAESLEEVLSR